MLFSEGKMSSESNDETPSRRQRSVREGVADADLKEQQRRLLVSSLAIAGLAIVTLWFCILESPYPNVTRTLTGWNWFWFPQEKGGDQIDRPFPGYSDFETGDIIRFEVLDQGRGFRVDP
jgi:hypothetical protein